MTTSRRDFLATTAGAALAVAFGRPGAGYAALRWAQEGAFTALRGSVGYFTMRGGTIGWLVEPNAVVVVDTQFPAEAAALLEGLQARSGNRGVDLLINTHHHGDHTGGNSTFRGVARKVVAHARAAEHMRQPPGGQPPADQLYPDTTFTGEWSDAAGAERIHVRHLGPAHTSGDAVITFERANVVHMGDLVFNQRHPVVDRPAGASIRNWQNVLDRAAAAHDNDTVYIFGHAGSGQPVTGGRSELGRFRDYLGALLSFVEAQVRAGRARDEILAMREPLAGFESFGPFGEPGPRDALTCAYEEVSAGTPQ